MKHNSVRLVLYGEGTLKMNSKTKAQHQALLTGAHNDYEKGLNLYAFFKVNNHGTGQDLVQETFMRTWSYLIKGGKIDVMKAFLYHVLNNLIVDEYRKRKATSLDVLSRKGLSRRGPSWPPLRYFRRESCASFDPAFAWCVPKDHAHALRTGSVAARNVTHHRTIEERACRSGASGA